MDQKKEEQFRADAVIASAYFHGRPPVDDRASASCANVLLYALKLTKLKSDEIAAAKDIFYGGPPDHQDGDIARTWYATLIDLTNQEPESAKLLDGEGNLEYPAAAAFTGCWLTPAGKGVAERLLVEHPEWAERLTADIR